jgi:hypothetical protein
MYLSCKHICEHIFIKIPNTLQLNTLYSFLLDHVAPVHDLQLFSCFVRFKLFLCLLTYISFQTF